MSPDEPKALTIWCKVKNGRLHPATHDRTTMCDLHHAEYQRAYSAWTTQRSRAADKTAVEPWEVRERSIQYTPNGEVWSALNEDDRARIRAHQLTMLGAAAQCVPMITDAETFYEKKAEELQAIVGNLVQAVGEAASLLGTLGQEPTDTTTAN